MSLYLTFFKMTAKELMYIKETIETMTAKDPNITDVLISYQIREARIRNIGNVTIKINR